jgi:echinoderm microtubule-associated protein-like 6
MKLVVPLGHISRCCAYNNDGKMLALGFGGRVGKGKESGGGIVRVYSADWRLALVSNEPNTGVVKLAERKDAKQWVSDVKFTPDGRTVVAGAHDCKIYIYDLAKRSGDAKPKKAGEEDTEYELKLRATFAKHSAVINHLDLSQDGRYMQSNCSAYELLFCDISTGKHVTSATELKDVKWGTWTCTLGWPVQGIWAAEMDGSDINATARSHTGHLLATSDDFGQVNLFRYPCVDKASKSVSFKGHSSHVMCVRWTCGDEYLLSTGGNDKCIFEWKHRLEDTSSFASPTLANTANLKKKVKIAGSDTASEVSSVAETSYSEVGGPAEGGGMDEFGDGPAGGDESGAVIPWLGAVRPPKNPPPVNAKPPAVELDLQWIYGYSSALNYNRPNLFYNVDKDIVYPAAALGVHLHRENSSNNPADWKQTYFRGHDDDVLCLTISPDRKYIATGQIASKALKGKASVFVWSAIECRILSKMEGCHQRGVLALSFSPDGTKLVSVGMDDSFMHTVWADMGGNWSRVQQIATAKGDKQPVRNSIVRCCIDLKFYFIPIRLNSFAGCIRRMRQ